MCNRYKKFIIVGLSGYHHEPMKLLQIMWLTTGISQRHRCRTKLVLKRRRLEVMAPTPNNFFECIADQLSHNPKMVAGGTKVIGPEIRETVHQFVITNQSLLQVSTQFTFPCINMIGQSKDIIRHV